MDAYQSCMKEMSNAAVSAAYHPLHSTDKVEIFITKAKNIVSKVVHICWIKIYCIMRIIHCHHIRSLLYF